MTGSERKPFRRATSGHREGRSMSSTIPAQEGHPQRPRLPIAVLGKAMCVLEALVCNGSSASLKEVVDTTGLDRTTVHRVLRTLVAEGFLIQTGRGRYDVAPRGLALGLALGHGNRIAAVAEPAMRNLQAKVQEAVNLAVMDGIDVVYVGRVKPDRFLSDNHEVGARLPAYCTSLGRSMLAFTPRERALSILQRSERRQLTRSTMTDVADLARELDDVRRQGYAIVRGELEVGLCCIAAPLLAANGEAIAAINVSVPEVRFDTSNAHELYAMPLVETVNELSRRLGFEVARSGPLRPQA